MKKIVTLGELLVRLSSPRHQRLEQAQQFNIDIGGAEANVAVSLAQLGDNVSFVSKIPDNAIGNASLSHIRKFGVDVANLKLGGKRMGLYFFENGTMVRGSQVVYDREDSSFADASPADFNWDEILDGADWFHWSGITPAVSESAANICAQAVKAAFDKGLTISMDYNYRANLWKWGKTADEVMPDLMQYTHVMSGTHPDVDVLAGEIADELFIVEAEKMIEKFPNCKVVVFTSRGSVSASHNTWQGVLYHGGKIYRSKGYNLTHIVDRVGGGDSFMAALIFALRAYPNDYKKVVEFATAASAIKHSIEGDQNICSEKEVLALVDSDGSGKISR